MQGNKRLNPLNKIAKSIIDTKIPNNACIYVVDVSNKHSTTDEDTGHKIYKTTDNISDKIIADYEKKGDNYIGFIKLKFKDADRHVVETALVVSIQKSQSSAQDSWKAYGYVNDTNIIVKAGRQNVNVEVWEEEENTGVPVYETTLEINSSGKVIDNPIYNYLEQYGEKSIIKVNFVNKQPANFCTFANPIKLDDQYWLYTYFEKKRIVLFVSSTHINIQDE